MKNWTWLLLGIVVGVVGLRYTQRATTGKEF